MEGKYLITTDNWFIAPDGDRYKAVFGEVEIFKNTFFGISKTNNWSVKVGSEYNYIIIAGSEIHYAVKTDFINPDQGSTYDIIKEEGKVGVRIFDVPTRIYVPD